MPCSSAIVCALKTKAKHFIFPKIGLWNHVFLFSNLSLFVFLPFSYLFAESSGFFGHRKGIISRFYETFTVFSLLAVVVLGITYIISAVIYPEKRGWQTFLSKNFNYQLFIYVDVTNRKRLNYCIYFQIWDHIICPSCTLAYHFSECYFC